MNHVDIQRRNVNWQGFQESRDTHRQGWPESRHVDTTWRVACSTVSPTSADKQQIRREVAKSQLLWRALACCRVCNRFVLLHPHHQTVTGTRARHLFQRRALTVTRRTNSSRVRCPKYRHIGHCPDLSSPSLTVIMRILSRLFYQNLQGFTVSKPIKELEKSPSCCSCLIILVSPTPFTSKKPPQDFKRLLLKFHSESRK